MKTNGGLGTLAVGVLSVVGVGVLWLVGGSAPKGGGERAPFVLPVTLAEVTQRPVAPVVELTGTVRSVRRTQVAFDIAGVVSSVEVAEADLVTANTVLAQLDARDQQLSVQARRADLRRAERELEKLRAGERAEVVRRLRAQEAVARAERDLAWLEVERGEVLLERKVISAADLDRLRAAQRVAEGRLEVAAEQLAEAEAGSRVEDLAIAEAVVDQARAALDQAERDLDRTILRAPWDGAIVRREVSPGDYVSEGEVVYELVDADWLEVEVSLPSRYALRLGPTPQVELRIDEDPRFLVRATLDAQVPAADRLSRNFPGVVRLPRDQAGALRPGMFVRLQVWLAPIEDARVVPPDALRETEQGPVVVLAEPGEGDALAGRWQPVRVLGADAEGVALEPVGEGALEVGAQVVVTGVDLAFPGVSLLPREQPVEAAE